MQHADMVGFVCLLTLIGVGYSTAGVGYSTAKAGQRCDGEWQKKGQNGLTSVGAH